MSLLTSIASVFGLQAKARARLAYIGAGDEARRDCAGVRRRFESPQGDANGDLQRVHAPAHVARLARLPRRSQAQRTVLEDGQVAGSGGGGGARRRRRRGRHGAGGALRRRRTLGHEPCSHEPHARNLSEAAAVVAAQDDARLRDARRYLWLKLVR
jgi:hypothetical protein